MENKEVKKTMKTLQVEGEKFGKNVVAYGKDLGIKLGKEATKFGKKAGEYAKTYSQILKLKAELEKTKYDIGNAIVNEICQDLTIFSSDVNDVRLRRTYPKSVHLK